MKKILLLAALALALPTAVFGFSSIDYGNVGGTLTASNGGTVLMLSGSQLTTITGMPGGTPVTGNLGSVSFTTGALTSGSLANGGTFAAGGTFTITGTGGGAIFAGTFTGATWTLVSHADGTHSYIFSGMLTGTTASGFVSTGSATVQLTVNTGLGFFNGAVGLSSGDTNIVVPEPGSLGLLGTGLIGLAGVVRRKLKA